MEEFIYLSEREKYAWINAKWVATQDGNAWSTAVYRDYMRAKRDVLQDCDYMFGNFADRINRTFLKKDKIDDAKDGDVVGSITVTYTYCQNRYLVKYRITKKTLI